MKKTWTSKDVCWFSNKYKRPIAYSTVADSEALALINQPNKTASELMKILNSDQFLVSKEMKDVVQAFVDKGLGNEVLRTN